MPNYYQAKVTMVIDHGDLSSLNSARDAIGITPTFRHTDAHVDYTRNYYNVMKLVYDGQEDEIMDDIHECGGHVFIEVTYDDTNFTSTHIIDTYFPTQSDHETHKDWLRNAAIFGRSGGEADEVGVSLGDDGGAMIEECSYIDFHLPYNT